MAHCAELNDQNIVTRVVVVGNEHADPEAWCVEFFGGGVWKQTSYNGKIRGKFAGVGDFYDEVQDSFVSREKPQSTTISSIGGGMK